MGVRDTELLKLRAAVGDTIAFIESPMRLEHIVTLIEVTFSCNKLRTKVSVTFLFQTSFSEIDALVLS